MFRLVFLVILFFLFNLISKANNSIIIQSTTSLKNSGFYNYILPKIYADLRIKINVVAVGSGAAIRNSLNCDGDLLIVHSPDQEKNFILKGFSDESHHFMYNYFVIIGPKADPAKIKNTIEPEKLFRKIFKKKITFISRADYSGTHIREMLFWKKANLDPTVYSGKWYLETGTSMGATINIAIGLNAYTLSDTASWITFNNKQNFQIMSIDSDSYINKYSALVISKKKCPSSKENLSNEVVAWLLSDKAKEKINNYKSNNQQLFFIK